MHALRVRVAGRIVVLARHEELPGGINPQPSLAGRRRYQVLARPAWLGRHGACPRRERVSHSLERMVVYHF